MSMMGGAHVARGLKQLPTLSLCTIWWCSWWSLQPARPITIGLYAFAFTRAQPNIWALEASACSAQRCFTLDKCRA